MSVRRVRRPFGVTALACLFALGAIVSALSAISLLGPGGPLEPMWRLNPRARESFSRMGPWALLLLAVVCAACVACAYGFAAGKRWGYRLGVGGLCVNGAGDLANAALGIEPRALIGVPVVALILWYLFSRRVRDYFGLGRTAPRA
ncbi:MAG TPA: hypothetical protein VMN82_14710 [Thermoanaerobaculia bacterium]|nr:hypothetical protein [Thermoanaerobaculia bacterium]